MKRYPTPAPHCDDCGSVPRKHFYVSVISGRRKALLAGPYDSHDAALDKVAVVRTMAENADRRSWFYAFGTAGSDDELPTLFGKV